MSSSSQLLFLPFFFFLSFFLACVVSFPSCRHHHEHPYPPFLDGERKKRGRDDTKWNDVHTKMRGEKRRLFLAHMERRKVLFFRHVDSVFLSLFSFTEKKEGWSLKWKRERERGKLVMQESFWFLCCSSSSFFERHWCCFSRKNENVCRERILCDKRTLFGEGKGGLEGDEKRTKKELDFAKGMGGKMGVYHVK